MKKHRRSAEAESEGRARQLEQVAQRHAKGDPIVAEILLWHLHYNWGKGNKPRQPYIDSPSVINGVKFWRVGHNASHEFYLGTGNGKRFRRAIGESCTVDWDGNPLVFDETTGFLTEPGLDESISEVTDFGGYHGHF